MKTAISSNAAGPIADGDRAEVLDALRGFALLGIFISHVPDFSGYTFMTPLEHAGLDRFGLDGAAAALQDFLIRGKFYSLFSLMFGIGFSVQLESAARRGADFVRHFARRLAVLLVIGLIHAGLWYGDILKDYALIGFALILLRRSSATTIAIAAASAFAVRIVWPAAVWMLVSLPSPLSSNADPGGSFDALTRAFGGADPSAMFLANLDLVRLKALQMIYDGRAISILAMFLLGASIGKSGLHRDVSRHRTLLRDAFRICAPIGLIGNAALTPIHAATPDFPPTAMWVFENSLYAIAVPAMAIAYASGFARLWSCGRASALRWLAPAGRMALTTYVSQTLIGIALFYGIGLGLHGRIGLVEGMIAAIAIFATQCAIAGLWLSRFRFGPIEWVWRRATYGAPIALVRGVSPQASRASL
ncbi:MAG TPA: DUF418 domain-containing protein [Rhizomicrobium sp.]|nr:DUF418 domain-containing protein [Rhizomicrobium sp.]